MFVSQPARHDVDRDASLKRKGRRCMPSVGRDRPLFDDALARLLSQGIVIAGGNTFRLKSP